MLVQCWATVCDAGLAVGKPSTLHPITLSRRQQISFVNGGSGEQPFCQWMGYQPACTSLYIGHIVDLQNPEEIQIHCQDH